MKPLGPLVVLLTVLGLLASCQAPPAGPLDALVDIGSHRLFIHCVGAGSPTVVIDTGIGETYESWEPLIESLGQSTRVCAYDRAGYGQSELGPMPRNSQRVTEELSLLLSRSAVQPPYVLVGHSLGGLHMQVFADNYPQKVAGVVLLDPSPLAWITGEGFPELREMFRQEAAAMREAAETARSATDPEAAAQADFLQTLASEFEQFFGDTGQQAAAIRSFGDMPLVVIAATEPEPSFGEYAQGFRQFWNNESRTLAGKSENGRFILAEGSSHHIHLDAPELVAEEILQIVQEARD